MKVPSVFWMGVVLFAMVVLASPHGRTDDGAVRLQVGVVRGWGSAEWVALLNAEPDLEVRELSRLTADTFKSVDVLVLTQRASALAINRAAVAIHTWVTSGGGLLCLHGSMGYQSHLPLLVDVGQGSAVLDAMPVFVETEHPVTAGSATGFVFEPVHAYPMVSVVPGPDGTVLARASAGPAVVVAGSAGAGRVVLFGIGAGAARQEYDEHVPVGPEDSEPFRAPEGIERQWVLNSVRWLAASHPVPEENP